MTSAPEVPPIERLKQIMTQLRDRVSGCPWDIEQNFASIAPYTVEEAYEVADAIRRGDLGDLREELGDLLLQVVFHAEMAREQGAFDFDAVATTIADKLVRRHPHVFGTVDAATPQAVSVNWEAIKEAERAAKGPAKTPPSALDGVALALPALVRAQKLQGRAARVGFDWGAVGPVLDKIAEEIAELRAELDGSDPARLQDEMGDVLFAVVNLARHLKLDAEQALISTNDKFERRFRRIEQLLIEQGISAADAGLDILEAAWQQAKREERSQ